MISSHNFSEGEEIFHHCTYSYIISKRGGRKMKKIIEEGGIWTSIDHMIMSMNKRGGEIYVHWESIGVSSQEGDKEYEETDYDNFGRKVNYDSDIWNNTERFENP